MAKSWDGGGTGNLWNTSANWLPDGVPVSADGDVTINGVYTVVIDSNAPDMGGTLNLGGGADLTINANLAHDTGNKDVTINNADMTQNSGAVSFLDDLRISGGAVHTVNGGTFYINDYYRHDSAATTVIAGGTWTGGSYLRLASGSILRVIGDTATLIDIGTSLEPNAGSTIAFVMKDGGITTIDVGTNMVQAGTLDITLDPGFVLPAGPTDYDLIDVAGSLSGSFGTTNLPNGDWSVSEVGEILRLHYVGSGLVSGPIIPEYQNELITRNVLWP